jgi:serine/threonine protein phosphatase PrpC
MEVHTAKFAGSYREKSEDVSALLTTSNETVLIVADGVGGQAFGREAAEFAVAQTVEAATQGDCTNPRYWYRVVKALDASLMADAALGQTTLVVVVLTEKQIVGVSVGDSAAWLVRPDGHFDLTGAQNHKPYLGSGAEPVPFALPLPETGTLVVATDGLFKYVPDEQILNSACHPDLDEAITQLARAARLLNGSFPDDIAILLCRFSRPSRRLTDRLLQLFSPPRTPNQ